MGKNDNDELKEKEKLLSQETLQKQKENEELRIKLIEAVQKRRDENPEEKGSDEGLKENTELQTEMDLLNEKISNITKENEELKNKIDQYKEDTSKKSREK